MVHCTWTLCKYCKKIKGIEGICEHPNGANKMIKNGDITVIKNSMIKCRLYSSKTEE